MQADLLAQGYVASTGSCLPTKRAFPDMRFGGSTLARFGVGNVRSYDSLLSSLLRSYGEPTVMVEFDIGAPSWARDAFHILRYDQPKLTLGQIGFDPSSGVDVLPDLWRRPENSALLTGSGTTIGYGGPAEKLDSRLSELARLKDGWFDGDGLAPTKALLAQTHQMLNQLRLLNVPAARLFATPDGGVQAEWTIGMREISVTFEANGSIYAQSVDTLSGDTTELEGIPNATDLAAVVLG